MKYNALRGMEDILPDSVRIWQALEKRARIELEANGYQEIRTPILEDTAIFVRSIGEETDIVKKEMYTFKDRKGRSLTLRPEGTAPIVRAYIEHSLDQTDGRLYYIGPMFRAERPQKGRSRQFHQVGVEIIGPGEPHTDAEAIVRMSELLKLFGVKGFNIKLNSIGCKDDKSKFAKKLSGYLEKKKDGLCQDCGNRLKKNILRVLDCKNEKCIQVLKDAPDIRSGLCKECDEHFSKVKGLVSDMGTHFEESRNLVRGLDYYMGTVFEVSHPDLGSQDALGAGGRYDNLVKDMGGPDKCAVGFALGMERVIMALDEEAKKKLNESSIICIISHGSDNAKVKAWELAKTLRDKWNGLPGDRAYALNIITRVDASDSSLKSKMRSADKNNARLVIILGEDEIRQGKASVKDMGMEAHQVSVDIASVVEEVGKRLKLC